MDEPHERFEVIRGTGPAEAFVELWDRSLAPGGLAFEAIESDSGTVTVNGHQVPVPLSVFDHFMAAAKSYLAPHLDDHAPMERAFLLQHQRPGTEDVKVIGAYLSEALAKAAIGRLRQQPGFRDYGDGFSVDA